jgi:hydantoinase/carbamoylase family amidase
VKENRWRKNIEELGRFGRDNGKYVRSYQDIDDSAGISRPEGSVAMAAAKSYIIEEMKQAGLTVTCDRVGNLFGRREGAVNTKAILTGSHLDTVANSGQLDGAYGVVAALESLRRMRDEEFANERPIDMIVFMGEEGTCFQRALLGSGVLAGLLSAGEAEKMRTPDGRSLRDVIAASCHVPMIDQTLDQYEFFVETHIEQSLRLYTASEKIGCVQSIAGLHHIRIKFTGLENHAGATSMISRRDPAVPASVLTQFINETAARYARSDSSAVATVDTWNMYPNSPSVISGKVAITVDIRAADPRTILAMKEAIAARAQELGKAYQIGVQTETLTEHRPCSLNGRVVRVIEDAARKNGYTSKRLFSGAIHDTLNIAPKVKSE